MAIALNHRGPDNTGFWYDTNKSIYLSHNRLSIIDLTNAGNQPMISHSGRYVISYNGEIYNHYHLKKELEKIKYAQSGAGTQILKYFWPLLKNLVWKML